MANTVLTAKNSFQEGLIMDFSPSATRTDCMTSALNATLLTFNGNEMSLLNDMGNGRVETAFLPEGYTPVGTCEFGDIIYIISYNPMINKAQIGCFPSPERNISSNELFDTDIKILSEDFLQLDSNKNPTGVLNTTSVKKILFDKNMHSGDLYIIYANEDLDDSYISDFGNTSKIKGTFPKFVKISIVSIDESGKMTYIDSNIKWYNNDYYINYQNSDKTLEADIDSYRSLVSSAYNTFSSKVPGKLALLFELERITSFDVSWECYEIEKTEDYSTYDLYWNFNWETNHNDINISKVLLSKKSLTLDNNKLEIISQLPTIDDITFDITRHYSPENLIEDEDTSRLINYTEYLNVKFDNIIDNYKSKTKIQRDVTFDPEFKINIGKYKYFENNELVSDEIEDTIINNYYKFPVTKKFARFKLYHKKEGSSIFTYKLIPAMPYGKLDNLLISGYIDFNKVANTNLNVNTWKYYINNDSISLTYGLDAVVGEGKIIKEVKLEFYDNQGIAASYTAPSRTSYNGTFTNTFTLNTQDVKLIDSDIYHTDGIYKKLNEVLENELDDYFVSEATHVFIKPGVYDLVDFEKNIWGTHKYDETSKSYKLATKRNILENDSNNIIVYHNDRGTLYKNNLYLVKIILTSGYDNVSSTDLPTIFERWMWTSEIFNNNYYSTKDFINLTPELTLDILGLYQIIPEQWNWEEKVLKSQDGVHNLHEGLSATSTKLNSEESNVKLKLHIGLSNNYNMFNLWDNETLNQIKVTIMEGNHHLKNYNEQPKIKYVNGNMPLLESIYPVIDSELTGEETISELLLYQSTDSYLDYKDSTNLSISKQDFNSNNSYTMKYNEVTNSYLCENKFNYEISENVDISNIDEINKEFLVITEPNLGTKYAYVKFEDANKISQLGLEVTSFFKFYDVVKFEFYEKNPELFSENPKLKDIINISDEIKPHSDGVLQFKSTTNKLTEHSEIINAENKCNNTIYIRSEGNVMSQYNYSLHSSIWFSDDSYKYIYFKKGTKNSSIDGDIEYDYYKCIVYIEPEYPETKEIYACELNNTEIPKTKADKELEETTSLELNKLYSFNNIGKISTENLKNIDDINNTIIWCIKTSLYKEFDQYKQIKNKELVYLSPEAQINLYKDKLIYLQNNVLKNRILPETKSKVNIYIKDNNSEYKYLTVENNQLILASKKSDNSLTFEILRNYTDCFIYHPESDNYLNLNAIEFNLLTNFSQNIKIISNFDTNTYSITTINNSPFLYVGLNNIITISNIDTNASIWYIENLEENDLNNDFLYKTNFIIDTVKKFDITFDENNNITKINLIETLSNVNNITEPGYYLFIKNSNTENNEDKILSLYYTTSQITNFSEKITYVDTNQNFIELDSSKITTYEFNAKALQNTEINLMLKSIKYDKYYRETDNSFRKSIKQHVIKSLLYTNKDLEEYNLTLAKTSDDNIIPMFKIGLAMGFGNMAGVSSHIEKSIVQLSTNGQNWPYFDLLTSNNGLLLINKKINDNNNNFIGTGWIHGSGDNNISYKKYCDENQINHMLQHYNTKVDPNYTIYDKIFFPIFLMHTFQKRNNYEDDDKKTEWSRPDDNKLDVPEVYELSENIPLNGSMSFFNKNNMYIQDEWCKGNALIYAKRLITFLRNIYYLSDTKIVDRYEPYTKNYAYLDDNYSLYTRDIITYVKSDVSNVNDILLIYSGSYSDYLEQIKLWSNQGIDETNVNFKLNNIIKNIPFLLKQEYKTPYENTSPDLVESTEIIVKSPDKSFNHTNINFLLNNGSLYGYDGDVLKPLNLLKTIKYDKNETYDYIVDLDDYLLTIKNSEKGLNPGVLNVTELCKYNIFNLDNFIKPDETNIIKMKYNGGNLITPKDTYSIKLSKDSDTDIGIVNFESNLRFFKDEQLG